MRITLLLFVLLLAGPAMAAPCKLTTQFDFEKVVRNLERYAEGDSRSQLSGRTCIVLVAGHMLAGKSDGLRKLDDNNSKLLNDEIEKVLPGANIYSAELFKTLADRLKARCPEPVRLSRDAATSDQYVKKCGLVRLPGTKSGLGRVVAENESGGKYQMVAPDEGAGGWTYGKYQMASEAGGIDGFVKTLNLLPEAYSGVRTAVIEGGGVAGAKARKEEFRAAFVELSVDDRYMQQAQEINHARLFWYPMLDWFATQHSVDLNKRSCGFREAVFSMRTQHSAGSTYAIINEAIEKVGKSDDAKLIVEMNAVRLRDLGTVYYKGKKKIADKQPETDAGRVAASYLKGVERRWKHEAEYLPSFSDVECP